MLKLKTILAAILLSGAVIQAQAQKGYTKDYLPYPYTYVSLQGGGQVTFTNYKASKLITPVGAISVGHFFTPAVGARLHVNGWKNKGGLKALNRTYDYNYVTSDLDLMLNLSNIFAPKKSHAFNAILVGGVGLSYAWDNDDLTALTATHGVSLPLAWKDDRLVHNFRVGMMFDVNVAKHVGINLEVAANNLHDRFNSKINGRGDWQLTASLGLAYKFGFKKKGRTNVSGIMASAGAVNVQDAASVVAEAPVVVEKPVVVEEPQPAPAPAPAPVPEPRKLEEMNTEVFFTINSSHVREAEAVKVKELADWLNAHPTADVVITGYADAGTGNAQINMRLSRQRCAAVKKQLTEQYGIAAGRITTGYKGDTVQPMNPNERNRVVIATAKEK